MEATPRTHRRARDRSRRRLEHWAVAGVRGQAPVARLMLVTPALAPYLRRGLLRQIGFAAERLAEIASRGELAHRGDYESSLWRIDAARRVLAKLGEGGPDGQQAVPLRRDDHPYVVYEALRSQFAAATRRAQDEAAEGRPAPACASGELAAAVSSLRRDVLRSATARREARLCGRRIRERGLNGHAGRSRG